MKPHETELIKPEAIKRRSAAFIYLKCIEEMRIEPAEQAKA